MERLALIPERLTSWYGKNKRPLPWRKTRDPYKIWISEIMLQQTQVETVIPYYHRWLRRFPNIEALAKAPLARVLKLWEGLGYYRRARNIHEAAKMIVKRYGGKIPSDFEEISELPGIGRYTAGAILSIAFGQQIPLVDGNVMRVFARLFAINHPIDTGKAREKMWELARKLVPEENPGDFNQALMELGATVCLKSDPLCQICPLSERCLAHKQNQENHFPVRGRQPVTKKVRAVCGILRDNGKLLIVKRPDHGLWAGLWEFPTFSVAGEEKPEAILAKGLRRLGIEALIKEKKAKLKRSYTIHREDLDVYGCELVNEKNRRKDSRWVRPDELERFPFPSAHAKIIRECL